MGPFREKNLFDFVKIYYHVRIYQIYMTIAVIHGGFGATAMAQGS
jgi:hypothetical protein